MKDSIAVMGTIVSIEMVHEGVGAEDRNDRREAVRLALDWFERVETCCTRFDSSSELMRLTTQVGVAVPVSPMLFEVVQFALAVAAETNGAFDPTLGHVMERRGFNTEHRTKRIVRTTLASPDAGATHADVHMDGQASTITIARPLVLDLGGVAKGFAVDLAARELEAFEDFAIDAGGDLYLGGSRPGGGPWSVGIRHPRQDGEWLEVLQVSDRAVCTSGDYERTVPQSGGGHHILNPRTRSPANDVASVTVVAPSAMLADALATAAFVLGPDDGLRLLERHDVDGLIVSPSLDRYATRRMPSEYGATISSDAKRSADPHPRRRDRLGGAKRRHPARRARAH